MTIKKIIKYATKNRFIILLLVLSAIIPLTSHAGLFDIAAGTIKKILAEILYWVLSAVSLLVYLAGLLLDNAINLAMGAPAKDLFTNPDSVVVAGWQIVRDIANIFFLFALLYIGISMILQLTTYGSKKILLGVVIAALLVNFSLPITRVVIDVSNVIAMEFLCKMTNDTCRATDLSSVLAEGLSFQGVFGSKDAASLADTKPGIDKILIAMPFGIVVLLVAAFVIFAGAILILMRTVILLILAIFSPLAFLFMALPGKAGSYANMWWDKLFAQCFFLPVYMFMLYLVVMFVAPSAAYEHGQLASFAGSFESSFFDLFTKEGTVQAGNAAIVAQYIIMIILLIFSLLTAQQLGAYGASGMIKLGQKAKSKTIGYAGRGARRVSGRAAERFATGEKAEGARKYGISAAIAAAGRGTRKLPWAGRWTTEGAADITAANRAKVAEIQKGLDNKNDTELKSLFAASSGFTRTAAANILEKRGNLTPGHGMTSKHIKALPAYMKRYGMDKEAKGIENLDWQYPETDEERKGIVQKASPSVMRKIMEDEGLSKEYLKPEIMKTMQESLTPQHYKAIYEANTVASHKFFESMTAGMKSIEEMAQNLQGVGTIEAQRSASWMTSASARPIMETYLPPKPPPSPPPPPSSPPPPPPKEGTREYADEQWKRTSKK